MRFQLSFKKAIFIMLMFSIAKTTSAKPPLPSGMPDGGCWSDPENTLFISLDKSKFPTNKEGSEVKIAFRTTPSRYEGWCYSTKGSVALHYLKSEVFQNASNKNPSFFQLSEDIDYKLRFHNGGTAPFEDYFYTSSVNSSKIPGIEPFKGTAGGRGTISFKLRRNQIGGAIILPSGLELANLYRYAYKGEVATAPLIRLVTQQVIIPVSSECSINDGQIINVPFGEIDGDLVSQDADQSQYRLERELGYQCNTALDQNIKVSLSAESAGFGDAIKTSNPDIGVVMEYHNQTIKPNDGFKTKLVHGQGSDKITFAVIGNGKTPETGPFTGSATLVITNL